MLGEIIYENKGKVTGYRVLNVEDGVAKIEATISGNGKFKGGVEATDIVTYWSMPRAGGGVGNGVYYYAEGQGVIMAKDSSTGTATWIGQGIGHYSGQKRRDVGSVFFRTSSSLTGKLDFLNNLVGVFEYEADEEGNTGGKIWEWK
jgi:hypothetical protein